MAAQAIGAGTSLLSGIVGGKGAKKAAQIQADAYQKGIDEQHRQFDTTQANFAPFLGAGQNALSGANGGSGLLDFLGLSGNDKQQAAYDSLRQSPAFTSLYNTGQDTILQNNAATGGLRGGNTQNSLANFGSNLLGTVLNQRLGDLGNLVNVGVGSANSLGSLGQQNANSVSTLLGQQGGAQAQASTAWLAALQGTLNQIGGNVGSGSGALSGIKGAGW